MSDIIHVSAPANVMLFGEHSVLYGHPAIVCALEPRIHVRLQPCVDTTITITSQLAQVTGSWDEICSTDIPQLSFVIESIRRVLSCDDNDSSSHKQGFTLSIDSEFSHTVGLGSSAAVVAASVYALLLWRHRYSTDDDISFDTVFDYGLAVIHAVQHRGSGSDLAASVFGGMVSYSTHPRVITPLLTRIENTEAQDNLDAPYPQFDLLYCGYKTPTPEVIAHVHSLANSFPTLYDDLYQQMGNVTQAAHTAIMNKDWHGLGALMNIYHGLLDALGVSDLALSQLVYTARRTPTVMGAKISGSGLGDCIITLSHRTHDHAPSALCSSVSSEHHIAAQLSPSGLLRHTSTH